MVFPRTKQQYREHVYTLKKAYSADTLLKESKQVLEQLTVSHLFREANCIALYHSLPDEVQTKQLIEEWYMKKQIVLPRIIENDICFYPYKGEDSVTTGSFGIIEPIPVGLPVDKKNIDLIIVPGVAFDKKLNRLGRGKGFYDRFLEGCIAPKAGICFEFQLFETIPHDPFDIRMDAVITGHTILYKRSDE